LKRGAVGFHFSDPQFPVSMSPLNELWTDHRSLPSRPRQPSQAAVDLVSGCPSCEGQRPGRVTEGDSGWYHSGVSGAYVAATRGSNRWFGYQPPLLFSHDKPATNNQSAVLFFSEQTSTSHQPNEQAAILQDSDLQLQDETEIKWSQWWWQIRFACHIRKQWGQLFAEKCFSHREQKATW
jgi:hypothetical protein